MKNFIIFLIIINSYSCCIVNNHIEGNCVLKENIKDKINFCKNFLPDSLCIPFDSVNYSNPFFPGNLARMDSFIYRLRN